MRCESEYQNPKNIFQGEHLPGALRGIIVPQVEFQEIEAITGFEKIAVIDDGVDFTLDHLKNRIAYQTDNEGKIRGAGYDILAQDVWPSPKHIDARVFAFGARNITDDGKIVEPLENPLASIDRMNEKFVEMFLDHVQNHEVLSKSLFTKLNKENFTLLGSLSLIQSDLKLARYTSISESEDEQHFNHDSKDPAIGNPDFYDPFDSYQILVVRPWSLSLDYGMPYLGYDRVMLSVLGQYIEHFDVFYQSLKDVYEKFSEETGFQKMMGTYVAYLDKLRDGANLLLGGKNAEHTATIALLEKWMSHRFGIPAEEYGFFQESLLSFCNSYPNDVRARLLKKGLSKEEEKAIIYSHIEQSFDTYRRIDEAMVGATHSTKDEKKIARNRLQAYKWFVDFAKKSASAHELELFTCRETNVGKVWQNTKKSKFFDHYHSPYYHKDQSASQGTGVASVIVANSQNTSILPIRVQANKTNQAKKQLRSKAVEWVRAWNKWLSKPVVFAGVSSLLEKAVDFQWEFEDTAARQNQVISLLSKVMRDDYLTNESPYELAEQLKQAIDVVALEGVRVANISLADQTSTKAATIDIETLEVDKVFVFLRQEFLKTTLAEKIKDVASETVFVVSAGDSGSWLDGQARTALPCDLSSPFFYEFETERQKLANNHIENILCVGSITRNGAIANFSNLTLTEVPFLFATGVEIPSVVTAELCLGSFSDYLDSDRKKNWTHYNSMNFYQREELEKELKEKTGIDDLNLILNQRNNWPNFLDENFHKLTCYEKVAEGQRVDTVKEKGTAFSAALVSAYLADYIFENSAKTFTAPQWIHSFLKELPTLGDESILTNVPILQVAPKMQLSKAKVQDKG